MRQTVSRRQKSVWAPTEPWLEVRLSPGIRPSPRFLSDFFSSYFYNFFVTWISQKVNTKIIKRRWTPENHRPHALFFKLRQNGSRYICHFYHNPIKSLALFCTRNAFAYCIRLGTFLLNHNISLDWFVEDFFIHLKNLAFSWSRRE